MIVFDASTLILLAKAELLESFLSNFKGVAVIPGEVEKECCASRKTLDAVMIQAFLEQSRIKVTLVRNRRLVDKFEADFGLGKGEAEAIALALQEGAQLLGVDDKNAIDACKLVGIPFTTAIGILTRAREKGLLGTSEAVAKLSLLAQHGRYKNSIIQEARRKLEGKT